MKNKMMQTRLRIISLEFVSEHYLQLKVVSGSQPCGAVDLISEKINFNIVGRHFFKGMETIKNIQSEYKEDILVFTFRNKKHLSFNCDRTTFTKIHAYISAFQE